MAKKKKKKLDPKYPEEILYDVDDDSSVVTPDNLEDLCMDGERKIVVGLYRFVGRCKVIEPPSDRILERGPKAKAKKK